MLTSAPFIVYLRFMMNQPDADEASPAVDCCGPPTPAPALDVGTAEADALLARLAKALGHPARIAIIRLLARREACVCGEIVAELPLAQSTVSQHLKVLKETGLIRGDVDGPRVCYCLEPETLALFKALAGSL